MICASVAVGHNFPSLMVYNED